MFDIVIPSLGVDASKPGTDIVVDGTVVGVSVVNSGTEGNGVNYGTRQIKREIGTGFGSDGTGGSIRFPTLGGFPNGLGFILFSTWVRSGSSTQNNKNIIGWWNSSDCNLRTINGYVRMSARTSSTVSALSSVLLPTDLPTHILGAYDGANVCLFQNGVLEEENSQSGNLVSTDPLNMFNTADLATTTYSFNGDIYDTHILTEAPKDADGNDISMAAYAMRQYKKGSEAQMVAVDYMLYGITSSVDGTGFEISSGDFDVINDTTPNSDNCFSIECTSSGDLDFNKIQYGNIDDGWVGYVDNGTGYVSTALSLSSGLASFSAGDKIIYSCSGNNKYSLRKSLIQ